MAVPERIYLQIGENCEEVKADFGNGEVTWSVDQIYSTDDAQLWKQSATKRYAMPGEMTGARVTVTAAQAAGG